MITQLQLINIIIIIIIIKINSVLKKIQNYRTEWIQDVRKMDGDRQTATVNYEISSIWESKPRTKLPKTSRLLMGQTQVTMPKLLQAV